MNIFTSIKYSMPYLKLGSSNFHEEDCAIPDDIKFNMVYILLVFAIIDDDNLQRSWTDKVMGKKKINAFSMIFFCLSFCFVFFSRYDSKSFTKTL